MYIYVNGIKNNGNAEGYACKCFGRMQPDIGIVAKHVSHTGATQPFALPCAAKVAAACGDAALSYHRPCYTACLD